MVRSFPLPKCLTRCDGPRALAGRLICALLTIALPGVAQTSAAQTSTAQATAVHDATERRDTDQATAAARRLLYPRWDPATGRVGEPFRSPSLGLEATDVRLADFQVAAVPDATHGSRLVAAALLEPQGFPAPYTLLEVAVLEQGDTGLRLLDNLKVRVDSGSGPAGLRMQLPPPGRRQQDVLRFEVRVTDGAGSLRHRFRHDRDGIALLESIIAR